MAERRTEDAYGFPSTHLSRLAGEADGEHWDRLVRRYWGALRSFLVANFGPALAFHGHEADEVLSLFAVRIPELAARFDGRRGRFRDLLKTCLRNHARDQLRRNRAGTVSLDEDLVAAEAADPSDVVWARTILARTLWAVRKECHQRDQRQTWLVFYRRVVRPLLFGSERIDLREVARQLGLEGEKKAANLQLAAERKFARFRRQFLAEYCRDAQEIQEEERSLRRSLLLSLRYGKPPP